MNLGKLIVSGTVGLVQVRTGKSKETGKDWRMTTALIPSIHQTLRVLLGDDLVDHVAEGDDVLLEVYPDVYQGKVTYRATNFYDPVGPVAARSA